jgi:hypothetical protein
MRYSETTPEVRAWNLDVAEVISGGGVRHAPV